uniref:C3H1-type domain-containing protein n=1 Tax=Alexandrium catenella TaxID=2925 RepID=A0A7S1RMK2_ALECA|mmetsp:Transcript_65155/g.173725  ORF Transcript_65155/g.173725 Transcript_65155/m.173725 type:complete len:191 (+) Transcript_65155:85-657(+)|eukprot:CAMPEP_0171217768 /NCGR_PEP_ID=MMETSP0790-20130122/32860_1 /TAXON_ID=2925 /ORGANISM="Alexandrium catenella, Strain OF101" /LENGTH=190 /DNA_ID=CAMNT_0011683577 /DNA_START=77 /DNA_END=649 /DNA_ORIENTATION=-
MTLPDTRRAFFAEARREQALGARRLPLPPGLCIRPPPGLSLAPPPGLELVNAEAIGMDKCGKWSSECSTVDPLEVTSIPSSAVTPRERSPSPPEYVNPLWQPGCIYIPGTVLMQAATLGPGASVPPPPEPLPSVGSASHYLGLCKSCDFTARSGGCREGASCKFCHICSPEVSQKRRKDRKKLLSAMKQY